MTQFSIRRVLPRNARGQAIVEMALVFPFFLLIVFGGIIDFGLAFYNFITLQELVADAARYGTEGNNSSGFSRQEIQDYINDRKPVWWTGNFVVFPVVDVKSTDEKAVIRKVGVLYESPMYTPFYITMFQAVSGEGSIKLLAQAAYQIPSKVE